MRGEAQREHGQAELLVRVLRVLAAERDELVPAHADALDVGAQAPVEQLHVEPLVPGGHRRVRGEDVRRPDHLARLGAGELVALHDLPQPLDGQERAVPLVHVADARLDAHHRQRAHAADAEEDLLAQAHVAVARIEARGDRALLRLVLRHVRIQQEQRHAADLHAPDVEVHRLAVELDLPAQRLARRVRDQRHRHVVPVVLRIRLLLPAVGGQVLLEVAFAVEQPDGDERQAEVAGGFQVVAGEDAEAAGVDRQADVNPELGGEVGDRPAGRVRIALAEPGRRVHVGAELRVDAAHRRQESLVAREFLEPLLRDHAEHQRRVLIRLVPVRRHPCG